MKAIIFQTPNNLKKLWASFIVNYIFYISFEIEAEACSNIVIWKVKCKNVYGYEHLSQQKM